MVDWDEHAAGWDENAAVREYAAAAFEALGGQLAARGLALADLRVLDFGCGTGLLSESLASVCKEVVALDPSEKMIAVLREKIERAGWNHVHAIAQTLQGALEGDRLRPPFDLVVCSSVCAFLDDYPGTARQLADLLGPGGVYLQFDWERDDSEDEPYGLAREEIVAALTDARLEGVRVDVAFKRDVEGHAMQPLLGIGQRPPTG